MIVTFFIGDNEQEQVTDNSAFKICKKAMQEIMCHKYVRENKQRKYFSPTALTVYIVMLSDIHLHTYSNNMMGLKVSYIARPFW